VPPPVPLAGTLHENGKGNIFHNFAFEIGITKLPARMLDIIQDTNGSIVFGSEFFKLAVAGFFAQIIGICWFVFPENLQSPGF